MLIALDYDFTFTLDPEFWRDVIALGIARGHKFVCVTGRDVPPNFSREPTIPMPVVCAGGELKFRAARRAGYMVDVWVDDSPGSIEPSKELTFDDLKIVTPGGSHG